MGLADRDYMRQRRSADDAPIRPPQQGPVAGMLRMALFWIGVLAALWVGGNWLLEQKRVALSTKPPPLAPATPTPQQQPVPTSPSASPRNADMGLGSPAYDTESSTVRTVSKCTVNGSTTYTEGHCPQGASATQLRVDSAPMGMLPPLANAPTIQQSTSVAVDTVPAQSAARGTPQPTFDRAAECRLLDAEIQRLDALARQPQNAQMQDWIRSERKKARDRQFEIRCQ